MKTKHILIAGILSFVAMFIMSGIWYGAAMGSFYEANSATFGELSRPTPLYPLLMVEVLIIGLCLAWLIDQADGRSMNQGLNVGIVSGILLGVAMNFSLYAVGTGYTVKVVIMDSLYRVVELGLGGAIVGMLYRKWSGTVDTAQ